MTLLNSYSYRDRNIVDLKTLIEALRIFLLNVILAIIFFFLMMEEIDWAIFVSKNSIKDTVIDNTPWNLNKIILDFVRT